jgi:zinc protease
MSRRFATTLCGLSILATLGLPIRAADAPQAPVAPPPAAANLPETAALPLDPAVRTGKLPNGLTYFIRRNTRPEKRADLWLAVNAGSTLEDDDQQGLAHFVEHMAFRGTKNFKKLEIINFLERVGMKFGPDVNAFTSFDETVYQLTVPTDDAAIIDKSIAILGDWSQNVTFDDADIDKERGVVVEEWRLGRGAEARMRDKQFPVLFQGSRYADRLTIGKKEILETAPHDAIRRFYRDWYRPDLMAVIAVGDFDPDKIEKAIKTRFAKLKNPKNERPRQLYPVPGHDGTLVSVATDPEATSTRVSVYYKLPKAGDTLVSDYRRQLVEQLYHQMIDARLDELRQRPDPPFLSAFSSSGSFVRTKDVVFQSATVQESGLGRGLDALLVELARVDKHGFLDTELDRAKKEMLRYFEQAYKERDKEESTRFTYEIMSHFLEGESMPGIEVELGLARRLLPEIKLDEVNHLAQGWVGDKNRVILVNGPAKVAASLPDEAGIRGIFEAAQTKTVEPWVDRVRDEALVSNPPEPGTIAEESTIPEIGVTRWKLSNGVVVLLKPTDFKNDQVVLSAFSPGGSSLVPDERYVSASFAGEVLSEGGLGSFDRVELNKALTGKIANASGFIGELEEGVRANASPQDLETMFQLVYLKFTAPRLDPAAFDAWKTRTKASIENRLARPETVFNDKLQVTMAQGHFRRRPMSGAIIDEIDPKVSDEVWRDRFKDAGDFTFGIVGAIKLDEIKPLVLRYLGGLPAAGRVEMWKDVGVRPPTGVVNVEVKKGIEPKSQVRITFTGPAKWTREDDHLVSALGSALRIRLREVLREDMGGVYGVGASGGISRRPVEQYFFSVSFGCAPERVAELQKAVFDVLDAAKKDGFSDEIVGKVKEQETREQETSLRENYYWLFQLLDAARYGEDPKLILKYGDLVKKVASDSLRDTAKKYLDTQRMVTGILYPEGAPTAAPAEPGAGTKQ